MTHPYGPASNPYGAGYSPLAGGNRPPLDSAASAAIRVAKARLPVNQPAPPQPFPPPQPKGLSAQQRADAMEVLTNGGGCRCCSGIHPGDELSCPRLATFELDGDGKLHAGSYWPDGSWDASRVLFAADAAEDEEEAGDDSS